MKFLATVALVGAASAATTPQQVVMKAPTFESVKQSVKEATSQWPQTLKHLEDSFGKISHEAKAAWDEVAMMFPEQMDASQLFSLPKKHTRRPDSKWDHIVSGAEIQSVWVENEHGEQEREIDGKLEAYNMRVKKVDPSVLGIDDVKQYSGYLDDNDNDKHLFYCESSDCGQTSLHSDTDQLQGSLSHATTPRTTPLSSG